MGKLGLKKPQKEKQGKESKSKDGMWESLREAVRESEGLSRFCGGGGDGRSDDAKINAWFQSNNNSPLRNMIRWFMALIMM